MQMPGSVYAKFLRDRGVPERIVASMPDSLKQMESGIPDPEIVAGTVFVEGILSGDAADLRAWGVRAVSAADIRAQLAAQEGPFKVQMNTPGGSASEGGAIAYEFMQSPHERNGVITGLCASAGTFVALACQKLSMLATAEYMIHAAWACACGNAGELREVADGLDVTTEGAARQYAEKTGKSLEEIRELMDATTYLSAAQAVEMGFADEELPVIATSPSAGTKDPDGKMQSTGTGAGSEPPDFIETLRRLTALGA